MPYLVVLRGLGFGSGLFSDLDFFRIWTFFGSGLLEIAWRGGGVLDGPFTKAPVKDLLG